MHTPSVVVVKQHMSWDGLNGAELGVGGFRRGKHTKKHDRKEHTIYPGSGLSEGDNTPTPALLPV
jgi:hypothetical protein